jgi:hypothetical protein
MFVQFRRGDKTYNTFFNFKVRPRLEDIMDRD